MNNRYKEYLTEIDNSLKSKLPESLNDVVEKAMIYSLFSDAKRIRPLLALEFCNISGGDYKNAIDYACAVEMVHTYSLIHDDLPCMDDDDMRRGKPSCHKQFGEEYALLAGDALLTYAFETISLCQNDYEKNCKAVFNLSQCSGFKGMILGQSFDLQNECKGVALDTITKTDYLKTSKLIECACVMGCIAAGADENMIQNAKNYSRCMGIAFQIIDDILDVTSTSEILGKPVGSDENNEKSTYVSLLGIDKAKQLAEKYTEEALASLNTFGDKSNDLKEYTKLLLNRRK